MPKKYTPEERAKLYRLKFSKPEGESSDLVKEKVGTPFEVSFNPESLAVDHRTQLSGSDQQSNAGMQIVGKGDKTLSVELFFDVTLPRVDEDDVRKQTEEVRKFIVDRDEGDKKDTQKGKYVPPGVRFMWGSFQFDGMMNSLNESLEFFDPEGHPLRASVSISIVEIEAEPKEKSANRQNSAASGTSGNPEERPEGAENTNGTSVQQVAARRGRQSNWKQIAEENGVENPRAIHNPDALRS